MNEVFGKTLQIPLAIAINQLALIISLWTRGGSPCWVGGYEKEGACVCVRKRKRGGHEIKVGERWWVVYDDQELGLGACVAGSRGWVSYFSGWGLSSSSQHDPSLLRHSCPFPYAPPSTERIRHHRASGTPGFHHELLFSLLHPLSEGLDAPIQRQRTSGEAD